MSIKSYLYTATLNDNADLTKSYNDALRHWGECYFDGVDNCPGLEQWMMQLHAFRGGDSEKFKMRFQVLGLDERLLLLDVLENDELGSLHPTSNRGHDACRERLIAALRKTTNPTFPPKPQKFVYLPYGD